MRLSKIIRDPENLRLSNADLDELDSVDGQVYGSSRPIRNEEPLHSDSGAYPDLGPPSASAPASDEPGARQPPIDDAYPDRDAHQAPASVINPPTTEEVQAVQGMAHQEGFEQGREEGIAEGREQGYQEGLQRARDETQAQVERLRQAVDEARGKITEADSELEQELFDLVVAMTRQVLQRELKLDPEYILAAIHRGISELPSQQGRIRIHLHPDELELVRQNLDETTDELNFTLIEDNTLSAGGCRLESGSAELDLDLSKRLDAVIAVALGAQE